MHRVYRSLLRLVADLLAFWYKPRPVPQNPVVLHVTPQYFADESLIGGGERYPSEVARAMADYVPTRIVSFGSRRRSLPLGKASLEIYPQLRRQANPNNPVALGFLPELVKADVIHCHQFHYLNTAVTIVAGVLLRKAIFVTDLGGGTTTLSEDLRLSRYVCRFLILC